MKGNKHGGRKTRIKSYKRTKHYRMAMAAKQERQVRINHSEKTVAGKHIGGAQ